MRLQNGIYKEDQMVMSLDHKCFKDVNSSLQPLLTDMFGFLYPDDMVYCYKFEDYTKPDFVVEINNCKHYVSMKTTSMFMHQERIERFVLFLKEKGISEETCQTILKWHYGDGTIDGSGHHRLPSDVVFNQYQGEIQKANDELNAEQDFIWEVVRRCVFQGVNEESIPADYLFMGDINGGYIVSKSQIYKYVTRNHWDFYENLHIGPLLFSPHARYLNKPIPEGFNGRCMIDARWPNLDKDMAFIARHYTTR